MANFFPLNTPFINYYFYKAPFINDAYSLTNMSVLTGGSGYVVNDIVILGGGIYTNPAVIKVTGVTSGAITLFEITSNGKYTVTPTTFTQLSTNGVGTGATFNGLAFTPNLYPIGPNVPLSGGFIYFYEDENRTVQANTYSDVFDPQNPVINPNPIQLGTSGDFPPIYMEDRIYYIVITDNTGVQANPVEVLEHYNPATFSDAQSAFNDNFIVNPQFNYPIEFYKTTDEVGEITQELTRVAWGWEFLQDPETTSKNFVTFENISGQQIEGTPVFQCVLTSSIVSASETKKDFRTYIGKVDFYAGQSLTFSNQMISLLGSSASVKLILELYYGVGGSETQFIELTTFTVGVTRQKFVFSFAMPSIAGQTIEDGNYAALIVQPSLNSVCTVGMTNMQCNPGIVGSPTFSTEPEGYAKALILGDATNIMDAGLYENYSSYYYQEGKIFPYADTGAILLAPTNLLQQFRAVCDGSSYKVNGYTTNNIPNRRLYDAIGTTFGGGGELEISSNGNVVTFTSVRGAREKSAYTAGNTLFTVNNTVIGLKYGIDLVNNFNLTLTGTFIDHFAPAQTPATFGGEISPPFANTGNGLMTYWGTSNLAINPANMTFTTITPGSGSTQATLTIKFNSTNPADYQTRLVSTSPPSPPYFGQASSFIDFALVTDNIRQPSTYGVTASIVFSLDGHIDPVGQYYGGRISRLITTTNPAAVINFLSSQNIYQNIQTFVKTVANPFSWTVTVTSAPSASQYFLYSGITTDNYGWFSVDGVGTDPAIAGRTGTEIPIFTGQDTTRIAEIIAETLNDAAFNVPNVGDLPALVAGTKVSWFINL